MRTVEGEEGGTIADLEDSPGDEDVVRMDDEVLDFSDEDEAPQKKSKLHAVRDFLSRTTGKHVHFHMSVSNPPTSAEAAKLIVDTVHDTNQRMLELASENSYSKGWWAGLIAFLVLVCFLASAILVIFILRREVESFAPPPPPSGNYSSYSSSSSV
jgi:hypothetical protein